MRMKVIEVNQIGLVDKDIIVVKNLKDFPHLNKVFFRGKGIIYKLTTNYYLVGADIAFVYSEEGSVRL